MYNCIKLGKESNYNSAGMIYVNYDSPAYAGYMFNKVYSVKTKDLSTGERYLTKNDLVAPGVEYYAADNIVWNSTTESWELDSSKEKLTGYQLAEKYCDFGNGKISYVVRCDAKYEYNYQLAGYDYYYRSIENKQRDVYYYGDNYVYNSDGTFTIESPTVNYEEKFYGEKDNLLHKYVCINPVNNKCDEIRYYTYINDYRELVYHTLKSFKYATSFSYDSNNNKYTLSNDRVELYDLTDADQQSTISNKHYTCMNMSGECENLFYITNLKYYKLDYVVLTDGENIEDALEKMLWASNVNHQDSIVKFSIDAWYKKNMNNYTNYLEDTIFCNDRSVFDLGGWNSNGELIKSTSLKFNNYNLNGELKCTNITDKFSMTNTKAQLVYPVGLLTATEEYLLNNKQIRKANIDYITMSPYGEGLPEETKIYYVDSSGNLTSISSSYAYIRPVVSLKPNTLYISGDGSKSSPYIIG